MNYTPLHLHTHIGSIGDSILTSEEAVKRAVELGMNSLAITDHGSMTGVIKHYKACINANIKPIIGIEAYVCKNRDDKKEKSNHLILLARNKIGYDNLIKICNDASINGFYKKPRVNENFLFENCNGITVLTACIGGYFPREISKILSLKNKIEDFDSYKDFICSLFNISIETLNSKRSFYIDKTIEILEKRLVDDINRYKNNLNGYFYLEMQPGTFEKQTEINEYLVRLSKDTDTPLVLTSDVHYCTKDEYKIHDYHVKLRKTSEKALLSKTLEYLDSTYYILKYDEFFEYIPYIDENILKQALENTNTIAESIEKFELYDSKIKMPKPNIDTMYKDSYDCINNMCFSKLKQLELNNKIDDTSSYVSRLIYEIETLKEVNFLDYMLVIKEFITYANNNKIPLAPGRGSVAGSLVAYLLDITCVDPIKYNLMFERFISIHRRGSVPDIDLDIGSSYQNCIIEYLHEKYGRENVSSVITFGTRATKAALRDVGRILNIDKSDIDIVSSLIPSAVYEDGEKISDLSIDDLLLMDSNIELKKYYNKYPEWFNIAKKLCHIAKSIGVHPSGKIISPQKINDYMPLMKSKNMYMTAFDLKDSEYAGGIKYDFLSSSTLDVINQTKIDLNIKIDYSDEKFFTDTEVWKLIGSVHTSTLFQIKSKTYSERMHRLKPSNIQELGNCLALIRSPCIISKQDEKYMRIIEGKEEIEKIHPIYDEVTLYTNGILLYQEDLMKILYKFGFSMERAFEIMKMAAKKKNKQLAEAKKEFVKLAKNIKTNDDKIERIWKIIYDTGKYSFNNSHAISYAINTYTSAWLKVNCPLHWMANSLTNAFTRNDKVEDVVNETLRLKIEFLPLDYVQSEWKFKVEDEKIRIGFCSLKGFGKIAYDVLKDTLKDIDLNDDANKILLNLVNNKNKSKMNKTKMMLLIFSKALSSLNKNHMTIFEMYSKISDKNFDISELQLFKIDKEVFDIKIEDDELETKLFRTNMIFNPICSNFNLDYSFNLDNYAENSRFTIKAIIVSVRETYDKYNRKMGFLKLNVGCSVLDCVVFSKQYNSNIMKVKKPISLYVEKEKGKLKAISVIPLYEDYDDPFSDCTSLNNINSINNINSNIYSNTFSSERIDLEEIYYEKKMDSIFE